MNSTPKITRVRHELRLRLATVARVEKLAPKMVRVTLRGEDLHGFTSLGFDDHVKLFFPTADGDLILPVVGSQAAPHADGDPAPIMRDFTPRAFAATAAELTIDFLLHGDGPATTWAAQAAPGQKLGIGGPKGSSIISLEGIDSHAFIGDETAIPAIGRRLEELPANTAALVVIEADDDCVQPLSSRADTEIVWVKRDSRYDAPGAQLVDKLRALQLPQGRCFAWAATETQAARAIRRHLTAERGMDKQWVKAAGYWQRGASGVHSVIQD